MSTKKTKIAVVLSVLTSLIITLSTGLGLLVPKQQQLTSFQLQNMLKNLNQNQQLQSSLEGKNFDPITGEDYGNIYEFAGSFQQNQLEVNQVTSENSLSNLGLIQGISFYNLSQEGYYNLISELHPVDIYGRYVPFTIDREWTKSFWIDDYLKLDSDSDNGGPMLETPYEGDIWDTSNFDVQMNVFEEALQDMDYGFQINENSEMYKKLLADYGEKWVQRLNTSKDYSQMMGNSDNSNDKHTNDSFTYKTSFRIILEVPAIIDHIEISMPRYYDGVSEQRGTLGIERMTMTDVYGNDFVTTMTNEDFHTNGKNFEDNSDNVITVPYQNYDNPEIASDTFADVWWNKFYLGSHFDTEPHVWTLDNSRDPRSSLDSALISSNIMDGFTNRLLSVNAPRGYVPLFVKASSAPNGYLNPHDIPQLPLNNFSLGQYSSNNDFSLGTVTVQEEEKYYLFFLKANFNIYQEFGTNEDDDYLFKPINNELIVPKSINVEDGLYELDGEFLAGVNPILGLMPYYSFINWASFKLPKHPITGENVVYARYKIDYNASLDETYKEDYWNYINLDENETTKLWLNSGSIITIEFYAKDNYRVIDSNTREQIKFTYNYEIPDLEKIVDTKMNDMDFPSTYGNSLLAGDNVINTNGDLSNLGLVSEVELYFRLAYENNDKFFSPTNDNPYRTAITEVNFLDSSFYSIPYNITYYSYDEGNVPGDIYSRAEYMRMTKLWNDGDVTFKSFENESNYANPFSVDDTQNTAFGSYNNYLHYRNNTEIKVKFSFDVPILLSAIKIGAGAYWSEDAPWISKINVTKSNGDKYSTNILRAARRNHPATNSIGQSPSDLRIDISYPGAQGFGDKNAHANNVNEGYLYSYYGIASLTWVKEEPISLTTNGSLADIGGVTKGTISFWAQQTNFPNSGISDVIIYDENGEPISYEITYTSHPPGLVDDISNPEIMKSNYEVFKKNNLTSNKNYYYTAPMSALLINWFEYKDDITINTNHKVWQETLDNTSYSTDFLGVFNFVNTYLNNDGNANYNNWNNFKAVFPEIFEGKGSNKLLNTMQSMINKLKANDGQAYVLNHKHHKKGPTFQYGDVTFDYLIVDFKDISVQEALKKTYATLQAVELSNWGGNNLTSILQDGKDNTNIELNNYNSYNWQTWDEYYEVDYKNVVPYIPYLNIEFVFSDHLPHNIGWIEVRSQGVDDLVYTPLDEKGKAPRRIDLSLETASGKRYNAKYVKGVQNDEAGSPFDFSTDNFDFTAYNTANYGRGEINWSTPEVNLDDNLGIGTINLENLLSRKLFAQVYNEEHNQWQNIDEFKIQNNDSLKIRFGFYLDTQRTIQGIFKNGDKWLEFYWKPPELQSKEIIYKAMPTGLPFEGINGYGTFDLSILRYSNDFDIEITVHETESTTKTYFNNLPYVLKNGQVIEVRLIAKNGALFYDEFGEKVGDGKTIATTYIVSGLSGPVSINFNQPLALDFNGYDGTGMLSFDEYKIPNELNWQIRVERNGNTFSYPLQTLPNKLFNGDKVYLDILGKNGYLINNQMEIYEYASATVDGLDQSKEVASPNVSEFNETKIFTDSLTNLGKYIISPRIKNLFTKWEENSDVNIVYSIFDDNSFDAIAKNITSIENIGLLEKDQTLEIILTPSHQGIVFVDDGSTAAKTSQKIEITISVDDKHIDKEIGVNYLPYDVDLLPHELEIKGGNKEGYLYFDSNNPAYFSFDELAKSSLDVKIYWYKAGNNSSNPSNANGTSDFKLDTKIFSGISNGDRIKISAQLKNGKNWINEAKEKTLNRDYEIDHLNTYASKEMIPELNLHIKGYDEHNTLANAQEDITSGAINALIPNYEDWMERNPNVFIGVYLLKGNDKERIKDLVMRDPTILQDFDPISGTGYRLDPTKSIDNLKNGYEILYYIVPKNKGELLYGDQSYYIFDYQINNLKISLPTPRLVNLPEEELARNMDGLDGEAFFKEELFRTNVIDDDLNNIKITVEINGNKKIFNSISELMAFKSFGNGVKITFEASPKPGYFWGEDLAASYAHGITRTFTFTSIPNEFQDIPWPDIPTFNANDIVFEGVEGLGFVSDLNIETPKHMDAYLSVSNKEGKQIYFWSIKDLQGNFLLSNIKYHLLRNGYFVKVVFRPELGYILPSGQGYPTTNEVEVTGLKYNIFEDANISKELIQGFGGINGYGKIFVPTIDPQIGRLEIAYLALGLDPSIPENWKIIQADEEVLTNGGTVVVRLLPNHDNGYVADYDVWKLNPDDPDKDFFAVNSTVLGLDEKITDEFIQDTLLANFGDINKLENLAWNTLPKGYTSLAITESLKKARNAEFDYYLYIYDREGNLVKKISVRNIAKNSFVTLENGYTIKLFAVSNVGYKFDVGQNEQDLSAYIEEIYYDGINLAIPNPLIVNRTTFSTNDTLNINEVTFKLFFENSNLPIPPFTHDNAKDNLLKYFDAKITISITQDERENEGSYDPTNDITLDLNSPEIKNFQYLGDGLFTFKIDNLTRYNTVKLTLTIKEEYKSQWMWIIKEQQNGVVYVNKRNQYESEINMDFTINVLNPQPIDKILFKDDIKTSGEAMLDADRMGLSNEYYDYFIQIIRNGMTFKYKIDQNTELPPLEINDVVKIEVKIKNEYINDYTFYNNGKRVIAKTLYEKILDSSILQLLVELPDLTIDDFTFIGPSSFAQIIDHPLLDLNNILLTYELEYRSGDSVIVKKYNSLSDLPTNLANGMHLRVIVKSTVAGGLVKDGKTYDQYTYELPIEGLDLPVTTPNFNGAIIFKATLQSTVFVDINWDMVFNNDLSSLEHLKITVDLRENSWLQSPIIKSSGPWKLSDFIENNIISEFNPQKGNLFQIHLKTDDGYAFTQNNPTTVDKSIVITDIQPVDIKIDDLLTKNSLEYAEGFDVSTIAILSKDWEDMVANLLANYLKVTFEVWEDGHKVNTIANESSKDIKLPTNLANNQEVRMILEVTNPDYWNISYQNRYYKTLTFNYDVEGLRTIIDKPSFPDFLDRDGFKNQVVIHRPDLEPYYSSKLQVKYQVSQNGGSFSEPLAIPPNNLTNGDQVKIIYQIKGEFVFYDPITKEVTTSIVSSPYILAGLESLVTATLKNEVFLIADEDHFNLYDYQKDNTNISFEYFVNGEHQESETLPKNFDVTKGIDIHLYTKNPKEQSFFDKSDEIIKHYQPDIYDVIDLPEDLAEKALIKNNYDDNYTFNNLAISHPENFEITITDSSGNKISTDLNNISPGSMINISIKTHEYAFYLLGRVELMNYKIAVPFNDTIKQVDVSDLNNITFEGVDGAGTIANIEKYDLIFKDPNIRFTYKVKHNGNETKSTSPPTNLFNGDYFSIELVPINTQVETIINYPEGGFNYQVTGLVSQDVAQHEPYINTTLYVALSIVGSVVLIGSFIVARKLKVG